MNTTQTNRDNDPAQVRTGAQCVIESLERAGVETIFAYPGGAIIDVFNLINSSETMHLVLPRHEQGGAHMAEGYARATGKVGVCLVTSGPGATNTVTALATANIDGIPLVCITGQVPTAVIGSDAFQEADVTGITRPVTKHNYLVRDVDELPRIIAEAFYIAASGKPGPVLVDIPKDIQRMTTTAAIIGPEEVTLRSYKPDREVDIESIEALVKAIELAKRPLLYVGGGTIMSEASEQLRELAHRAHIPVTTTLMALGAFPEDDPLALKMLGMHGSVAANRAVAQCDLLISVGARFDDRVTGKLSEFAPLARVAHIDIDRSAIGKNVAADISLNCDVKKALEAVLERIQPLRHDDWTREISAWKEEYPFVYDQSEELIVPQYVIEQIDKSAKGGAIISTDVGQHQMWAAQFINHQKPRDFITSGGLGTMGFGLPAAIGAAFACPGRPVVCITGDGSIQMNFQELVVAVEHNLPVKVAILNNGYLGMVRQWQEIFYDKNYSAVGLSQHNRPGNERIATSMSESYLPDFVKLAEAHGAIGVRVTDPAKVLPTIDEALASPKVWVMEFRVTEEENVFPMLPPGGTVEEMIYRLV